MVNFPFHVAHNGIFMHIHAFLTAFSSLLLKEMHLQAFGHKYRPMGG